MTSNLLFVKASIVVLLFVACTESPTHITEVGESRISAEQIANPNLIQSNFENPDDCVPIFDGPDCDSPGNPGGPGGSTGGPNMMYFNAGNDDKDLYYSFNSVNFSTPSQINWSGNSETPNTAQSKYGPAAVYFNNKVYAFYRKKSPLSIDDVWFSETTTNPIQWSSNKRLPVSNSTFTDESPSAIVYDGKIYVFTINVFEDGINYTTSSDGMNWSPNYFIPNKNFGNFAALGNFDLISTPYPAVFNDKLYVFYTGIDTLFNGAIASSTIRSAYSSGGTIWNETPAFIIETNNPVGKTVGSPVVHGNTLFLIYTDSNGYLRSTSTTDLQSWSASVSILTARTNQRPTAVSKNGHIILLHKGATRDNIHMIYSSDGVNWSGNVHVPGQTDHAPYIISID